MTRVFKVDISAPSISASSIIKSGGTSSQFLKADGSIDSSTYLTTGTASSTYAPIASPSLTGTPLSTTAAADTNTTQIATTAYVIGQGYLKTATAASTYQPLDADLTSIAALSGTGLLKNTSGTWSIDTSTYLTSLTGAVLTAGGSTITVASGTTVPLTIQNNGTGNSFVVNDVASDTTSFIVDSTGTVGIKTATPNTSFALDVNGAIAASGNIASYGGNELQLVESTGNNTYKFKNDANNLTIAYNATERMRIDNAGNVGIGTTSNVAKLNVISDATTPQTLQLGVTASDTTTWIQAKISRNGYDQQAAWLYAPSTVNSSNPVWYTGLNASSPSYVISTYDGATFTERVNITSTGNVGIGTASPTTKLDILSNSASLTGLSVSPHSSGLTATITAAVQSGGTVTYTATNTFTAGQQVTITGITPTTYNVNNVTIKTATGSNFTIATATLGGTYVSGGTATAYANLQEWQTNAGTQLSAISQNGAFSSSSTETIIENSGDTFGTTRLRLQNRSGQGGPLFEQAGTVDVVDFGFKIPSSQSLIRYEGRYGSQFAANPVTSTNGPEFQFGNASTTTQGATVGTWFPLVVGAGLLDKRVQINSTTGNNTALTIKAIPTKTATITGATVTTFTNKSGTIVIPQAVSASFSRITGIASTTGLLAGMTLTYVSGTGTFGGGTATIISVDSSTAITVYTTAVAVAGATVFSIQNSVTYTATNAFSQTHGVTITGATAAGLNVAGATIGAVTGSTFTIINTTASGTWSSGGTATITQTSNLTDWIGSAGTSIASISAEGNLTANQFIASNNGNGTNFKVGDDVWIGDIDIANTMSVRGAQSAASGFIRFGSDTNALGYNGTAFSYGGAMTATSFNSITGLSSTTPIVDGTAAVGTGTTTARGDHVHPTDTSRAAIGQTMYIGTTAVAINRTSASLALTGITSIDGSAATLTTSRSIGDVSFNGSAGIIPERILYKDTRSVNHNPFAYPGLTLHLKANTADSLSDGGTYHGVLDLTQWGDSSGGISHQLGLTDNGNMWLRYSTGATTWSTWGQYGVLTGTAASALGSASAGSAGTSARADHIHPTTGLVALSSANTFTNTNIFNSTAAQYTQYAKTVAPTADMVQITNAGFPNVTAGISALQINYVGGAAAIEATAARVDITPGTTSGGTWNGFRVIPVAAAATGVVYNAMKFDSITANGGTDNIIYVGTGYDNIISYNGTSVINGSGQLNLIQVTGFLPVANGGTGATTSTGSGAVVLGTSPTITPAAGTTTTAATGAGYMGMPQVIATTGAATVAAADAGKHIYSTATRTITIDSNTNLALPVGTAITFISGAGATTTIAITTDTMYLAGTGATGSRTLVPYGMATAVKIASTTWIISGSGLT